MKKLTLILMLCILLCRTSSAADTTFYFTTSDTVKLFVKIAGKGKPCLFVHGGPGSTSYYFEALPSAQLLEQKVQMIYFDQRGSGRSGSPASLNFSADRISKDMEELREYLKIKQWNVMGHSFAGLIITDYALRYPKSLSSLLYVNATLNLAALMNSQVQFGIQELHLSDNFYFDNKISVVQKNYRVNALLNEKGIWYKMMYRNAYEKFVNDSITDVIMPFNHDFAAKAWNIPEYTNDLTLQTKLIQVPVFIITGDRDFTIGPNHYQSFQFPKQNVVHYIGGHVPFQEEPQWFSETVLAFFKKISGK